LIYALIALGMGAGAIVMLGLISLVRLFEELDIDEDE
jgi:hypothetical protein